MGRRRSIAIRLTLTAGLTLALILATGLGPGAVQAGGQGQGLPDPSFIGASDDTHVLAELNTIRLGAPSVRWVHASSLGTKCIDPQLQSGQFPPVDGVGGSVVCVPDFIPGATLPVKIRAVSNFSETENPPGSAVFDREVDLTITLSVVTGGGEVTVQTFHIPTQTYTWDDDNFEFLSQPPLLSRAGWVDGNSNSCSGELQLDFNQEITVERIAAPGDPMAQGEEIDGLDRAALIAIGQQELPGLLCQAGGGGGCTFLPSVAFLEIDGTLTPTSFASGSGASTECDATVRFAQPATTPVPAPLLSPIGMLLVLCALVASAVIALRRRTAAR